jgi:hypothetical protein
MATQLPISSRKILITSCQTQSFDQSDYENFFFPALKDFHTGTFLSRNDFYASVADIVPSPVMSSIFWMVLSFSVYMLRSTNITSLREGECLMMNESPWISAMEDMGFLEKTVLQEWLYVAEVSSQRILRKMSRRLEDGMVRAVGVKCLRSIPECYVDAAVEEKVDAVEPMEWERY